LALAFPAVTVDVSWQWPPTLCRFWSVTTKPVAVRQGYRGPGKNASDYRRGIKADRSHRRRAHRQRRLNTGIVTADTLVGATVVSGQTYSYVVSSRERVSSRMKSWSRYPRRRCAPSQAGVVPGIARNHPTPSADLLPQDVNLGHRCPGMAVDL
jgi:hypothetical protein